MICLSSLDNSASLSNRVNVEIVRIALTHLPANLPRVGFADSMGLGYKGNFLHFSGEAKQEMGRRYAAALKAIP